MVKIIGCEVLSDGIISVDLSNLDYFLVANGTNVQEEIENLSFSMSFKSTEHAEEYTIAHLDNRACNGWIEFGALNGFIHGKTWVDCYEEREDIYKVVNVRNNNHGQFVITEDIVNITDRWIDIEEIPTYGETGANFRLACNIIRYYGTQQEYSVTLSYNALRKYLKKDGIIID